MSAMEGMIRCPRCAEGAVSRTELYRAPPDVGVKCPSCRRRVVVTPWFKRLPAALGGIAAPVAVVAALLYGSWIPLAALFLGMGLVHCVVYARLGSMLREPRAMPPGAGRRRGEDPAGGDR